jgi:hypothetical protein
LLLFGYSNAVCSEVSVAEYSANVAETGTKPGGECEIRTPDFVLNKGKHLGTLKQGAPQNMPGLAVITDGDFRTPGGVGDLIVT